MVLVGERHKVVLCSGSGVLNSPPGDVLQGQAFFPHGVLYPLLLLKVEKKKKSHKYQWSHQL